MKVIVGGIIEKDGSLILKMYYTRNTYKVSYKYTGNIPLNAALSISNAIKLIILSIVLTLIGGLIPARAASKKDPVEALRTD